MSKTKLVNPSKIFAICTKDFTHVAFRVPGIPVAKGRPVFSTYNGIVNTRTPEKTKLYENWVKECYENHVDANDRKKMMTYKYFSIEITIYLTMPERLSKNNKQAFLNQHDVFAITGFGPNKRPDVDNVAKTIMDALNGYAYPDDRMVTCLNIMKRYTKEEDGDYAFVVLKGYDFKAEDILTHTYRRTDLCGNNY